jgi:hypothetical protein
MFKEKEIRAELTEEIRRAILGFRSTARGARMIANGPIVVGPSGSIVINVNATDAFAIEIKFRAM